MTAYVCDVKWIANNILAHYTIPLFRNVIWSYHNYFLIILLYNFNKTHSGNDIVALSLSLYLHDGRALHLVHLVQECGELLVPQGVKLNEYRKLAGEWLVDCRQ